MMKFSVITAIVLGLFVAAYFNANSKLNSKSDLNALHLQMSVEELETVFGSPSSRDRNSMTYILEDSSTLYITLRDDVVASAVVKYHSPLKIEDPELRRLTLVQMQPADLQNDNASWFYAGKPEEGLIYKITQSGEIESMTWVPPFSYGAQRKKNLQALLRDFKNQHTSQM